MISAEEARSVASGLVTRWRAQLHRMRLSERQLAPILGMSNQSTNRWGKHPPAAFRDIVNLQELVRHLEAVPDDEAERYFKKPQERGEFILRLRAHFGQASPSPE